MKHDLYDTLETQTAQICCTMILWTTHC